MKSDSYSSANPGRPAQPESAAKTICFDLDGTLCTNTFGDYDAAEPFAWAIERVNQLARAGHRIVVFTARGTATGIDWEPVTRGQLERWGVSYDDLRFGKPSADVYVDDRAVHTTAWREGDAFTVPGLGLPTPAGVEELPGVLPPQRAAVVESGRTFAGEPFLLGAHVERARTLAAACGLRALPDAAALSAAVAGALGAAAIPGSGPPEDLIFTISISEAVGVAFIDALDPHPAPGLRISCRGVGQATTGLRRLLDPHAGGTLALAASIDDAGSTPAWPLESQPDGSLRDALGATLGISRGREVLLAPDPGPPQVVSQWLGDIAADTELTVREQELSLTDLRGADEVFVASVVFGLLPVASVQGEPLGTTGGARTTLTEHWSRRVGVDVGAQVSAAGLGRPETERPA